MANTRSRSNKTNVRKSSPSNGEPASSQVLISLENEKSRTSKRQRQSVISTNLVGSQTVVDLVSNEPPNRKRQRQGGPSRIRVTPRVLVSIEGPISTHESIEADLQKPSAFEEGPICHPKSIEFTMDELSTCEGQQHGVITTNIVPEQSQLGQRSGLVPQQTNKTLQCLGQNFQQRDGAVTRVVEPKQSQLEQQSDLVRQQSDKIIQWGEEFQQRDGAVLNIVEPERSQPRQQSDAVRQQSGEAIQSLGEDFQHQNGSTTSLVEPEQSQPEQESDIVCQESVTTIQCLREEVQQLRHEIADQRARQFASMNSFIPSAAVMELVVDVREAELGYGLSSIGGTPEEMLKQAQQMRRYSKATSQHASRLVNEVLEEQRAHLNDDQRKAMCLAYMSAQPSQATAAILEERLPFVMGRSRE